MQDGKKPGDGIPKTRVAPATFRLLFYPLLVVALWCPPGCIPTYTDFGSDEDIRPDLTADTNRSDMENIDSVADTKSAPDLMDAPGPSCGDWVCSADETCHTCPNDCGECCGQGGCQEEFGENRCTCPKDCGDPCEEKVCGIDGCGGTCGDCDDNNSCTEDACIQGSSCEHHDLNCNDDDACTADSCDPETGCIHTPLSCDDVNYCTEDSCDPETGCVYSSVDCDDGDDCTADTCDPEVGCANSSVNCDDEDDCTDDIWIDGVGCTHPSGNDGGPCQDNAGTCLSGSCCIPDCIAKMCGDDGCGGSCGACGALESCIDNQCNCEFEACGDTCCENGQVCNNGECVTQ